MFEYLGGQLGVYAALNILFFVVFLVSLPAAIIAEIVRWIRRRKKRAAA